MTKKMYISEDKLLKATTKTSETIQRLSDAISNSKEDEYSEEYNVIYIYLERVANENTSCSNQDRNVKDTDMTTINRETPLIEYAKVYIGGFQVSEKKEAVNNTVVEIKVEKDSLGSDRRILMCGIPPENQSQRRVCPSFADHKASI